MIITIHVLYLVYRILLFERVQFCVRVIFSVLHEHNKFLEENNLPSTNNLPSKKISPVFSLASAQRVLVGVFLHTNIKWIVISFLYVNTQDFRATTLQQIEKTSLGLPAFKVILIDNKHNIRAIYTKKNKTRLYIGRVLNKTQTFRTNGTFRLK